MLKKLLKNSKFFTTSLALTINTFINVFMFSTITHANTNNFNLQQIKNISNIRINEPKISAKSYLLMDFHSGKILASKEIDTIIEPASLTKMMTMYVVEQEIKNGNLNLNEKILVSKKAWKTEGSRMFLEVGKKIKLKEIIKGIIISSANDGCVAVAEHIAGSEDAFSEIMTSYAKALNMHNTNFTNSTGLPDPNHYTTARDLAILAQALIKDFPKSYKLYAEKSHTHIGITQLNRNRLLWRNSFVDGIKTGHTESAGFCLVASAKNNNSNGMRLISIIIGATSDNIRTNESNKLLTWGFRFFETHKLYEKEEEINKVPIFMGKEKTLPIGFHENVYVTIKKGLYKNLHASIDANKIIKAPIKKGDIAGKFIIKYEDELILEKPVIALKEVSPGNIFIRTKDYLKLSFKSIMKKF